MIRHARRSRAIALVTLAVVTLAPALDAQATPTAEQVIERHVAAIGGRAAWQRKQSMRLVTDVSLGRAGTAVEELLVDRAGHVFTHSMYGLHDVRGGFDGETAWEVDATNGASILTGKRKESLRMMANLPLVAYEKGSVLSATLVGAADFDGRKAWQLTVVPLVGREMTEYFDQETGFKIGARMTFADEAREWDVRYSYRDYTRYGDVMYPKTTAQYTAMAGEQVATTTTLEFDTVPASAFALPDAVRTLRKP